MSQDYRVLQDAAQWFALHAGGRLSDEQQQAWQHWLLHPEHVRAWQKVQRISGQMQRLGDDGAARTAASALGQRPSRRQVLGALGVLVGAGALAWHTERERLAGWTAQYRTGVGERREVQLADASTLWLNTDSALDLNLGAQQRRLYLYRGEALLDVHGEPRPLTLRCAAGQLHTQSARFSVRTDDGGSRVDVFRGQVQVQLASAPDNAVRALVAGQFLRLNAHAVLEQGRSDDSRQGWIRGMLMANERRLDEVLAELSRYRHGHLGCDPRIAGIQVVGAFPLADTDRVLDALAATLPVRIQRTLPWWVSVEPA